MAKNGGREVRNKHGALLRGLLHCAACNCGMSHSFTSKGTRQYRYYTCQNAQSRGWEACPSPSVPAGEIEAFVVDEIKCIGRDPGIIKETIAQARAQLEEQIEGLKAERSGLWQRLRDDHALLGRLAATAPPGDPRLADANDRIREAERRVSEVDSELATLQGNVLDENEVANVLRDFNAVWDCLSVGRAGPSDRTLGRAGRLRRRRREHRNYIPAERYPGAREAIGRTNGGSGMITVKRKAKFAKAKQRREEC
jgi:site-specific DNA recombinase